MIAQKDVTHLYVLADAALTAAAAAPSTARYLGVRRIGETLCDATALVAGDSFQVLYYDNNSKLNVSPILRYNDIVEKSKVAPTSAASQVSTIGYNGTDGDIVETSNGKYLITLGFKDILKQFGNKRLYKYGAYDAGATCYNYNVAIGLAGNLQANLSRDVFQKVTPKAVCSFAVTAADKLDHDLTVVKGSSYVTEGTHLQYSTGESIAVGDYLRLGSVAGGTALTSDVYRVVELTSSTVMKLDRPVSVASGTYASGTADAEIIRQANAELAATKWGIILTANDSDAPFELGKYENNLITFSVGVSADFGTTEVRLGTSPVLGKGTYKDVACLDWFLQNNRREAYRIAEYPVTFVSNASSADTYTYIYTIKFKERSTESIGDSVESFVTLMIVAQNSADANLTTVFGF